MKQFLHASSSVRISVDFSPFKPKTLFIWCDVTCEFAIATSLLRRKKKKFGSSCGARRRSSEFARKIAPRESGLISQLRYWTRSFHKVLGGVVVFHFCGARVTSQVRNRTKTRIMWKSFWWKEIVCHWSLLRCTGRRSGRNLPSTARPLEQRRSATNNADKGPFSSDDSRRSLRHYWVKRPLPCPRTIWFPVCAAQSDADDRNEWPRGDAMREERRSSSSVRGKKKKKKKVADSQEDLDFEKKKKRLLA